MVCFLLFVNTLAGLFLQKETQDFNSTISTNNLETNLLPQMEFSIEHTWDSNPVDHDPTRIIFSPGQGGLKMEVLGPFFNDPAGPAGPIGQPFPGLWDYEGGWKV